MVLWGLCQSMLWISLDTTTILGCFGGRRGGGTTRVRCFHVTLLHALWDTIDMCKTLPSHSSPLRSPWYRAWHEIPNCNMLALSLWHYLPPLRFISCQFYFGLRCQIWRRPILLLSQTTLWVSNRCLQSEQGPPSSKLNAFELEILAGIERYVQHPPPGQLVFEIPRGTLNFVLGVEKTQRPIHQAILLACFSNTWLHYRCSRWEGGYSMCILGNKGES